MIALQDSSKYKITTYHYGRYDMETKMMDKTNRPTLTGNWEPQNKLRLERLIAEKAFANNYAVFDWDYTCIFYDIQDSLFCISLSTFVLT